MPLFRTSQCLEWEVFLLGSGKGLHQCGTHSLLTLPLPNYLFTLIFILKFQAPLRSQES